MTARQFENRGDDVDDVPRAAAKFSADGKTLVSAGLDKRIRVWDMSSKRLRKSFDEAKPALAVDLTPEGKHLLVLSADGTITRWDWDAGTKEIEIPADARISTAFFMAWGGKDRIWALIEDALFFWDNKEKKMVRKLTAK